MVEAMEIKAGFKQTEVGVIPSDWEVKKLADLVDKFVNGGTPSTQITEYWNGNIPWITGADILNQKVAVIRRYISKEAVKNSSTNIIEKGNLLLVSRTGVGKIAITPFDIAISQDFTGIYVKSSELDTVYLFRYFDFAQKELKTQNQGTSIQGITRETLSSIKIPLPPTKAEQTAIATALNDADALITQLEKLIAKKRDIKQGAMQELLKPKAGWAVEKLPALVWFQEGPGVRKYQFTTSGVKLLNGTNIENGILLLDKTDRFISNHDAFGWYSHFLVDDGDILIACSGISVDKFHEKVTEANKSHLPLCMNTSTMRFKILSKRIIKPFFFHFLKSNSFKQQIGEQITGSAQLNFGPAHVKWVEIHFPSVPEQEKIAQILSDMDVEIEALEKKLDKYKMLKQGMMQNLLTGRIRLV